MALLIPPIQSTRKPTQLEIERALELQIESEARNSDQKNMFPGYKPSFTNAGVVNTGVTTPSQFPIPLLIIIAGIAAFFWLENK